MQHVLDAEASMASSAIFWGIVLRVVSGCCYNNGGLRSSHYANEIRYQQHRRVSIVWL